MLGFKAFRFQNNSDSKEKKEKKREKITYPLFLHSLVYESKISLLQQNRGIVGCKNWEKKLMKVPVSFI